MISFLASAEPFLKAFARRLEFLTKISEVIGGTSVTIFRSAIDGYNKRFNKEVQVKDTIKLSNIPEEERLEFVLGVFYVCIGPITWEEAN